MTNPTPHGQVPEALIDLIDEYAETRHRCGGIYNARTEAARKAVIEALSGVQALSAAQVEVADAMADSQYLAGVSAGWNAANADDPNAALQKLHESRAGYLQPIRTAARALALSTPPAEQQAQPDECFPGEPKVAVPQGLISAACFAIRNKRDGGKVLEQLRRYSVGDRSQPLAPQQAAPKAAPGDVLDEALRERDEAEDFINELLDEVLGADRPEWSSAYNRYDAMSDVRERITALHKPAVDKAWGQFQSAMAAPQQEAQEPVMIYHGRCTIDCGEHGHHDVEMLRMIPAGSKLYTAPQPAPAPLSDDTERLEWLLWKLPGDALRYVVGELSDTSSGAEFRAAIDAALAAQGGKV